MAAALLADDTVIDGDDGELLPDVRERDGWVFSSLPLEVSVDDDGIEVRRLRQIVCPDGELSERSDVDPPRPAHARGLRARG